jgi:predicted DNA-binding transcriptional regulator AlpA
MTITTTGTVVLRGGPVSSIWRLARQGQFPAPVRLSSSCTGRFEHEIAAWLDEKSLKRDAIPRCGRN